MQQHLDRGRRRHRIDEVCPLRARHVCIGKFIERALDAYEKARELAVVAPRLSLDPAATVFQLGGILAEVAS